ncbi:MAG: M28 family peptidase [Mariniblastus sp.]
MMKSNQNSLYQHVEFLTQLRPFRNYLNLDSLEKVCDYLKAEFEKYGLVPSEQKFIVRGQEYKNILATYNADQSQSQRRLIVGAHYDVCGDQPGADDNASAVAGLLEIARMVAEAQPKVDYRIDFVAYCLEEPPFFATPEMGSYIHAESVAEFKDDIIGLINFEMIGYFHEGPQDYPIPGMEAVYPSQANFVVVVGLQEYHEFNQRVYDLMQEGAGIDVQLIDDPRIENLAGLSDQRSYWEFGIPALMVNDTSYIRNQNYHQMSDDIDTLCFDSMQEVVTATYKAVVGF